MTKRFWPIVAAGILITLLVAACGGGSASRLTLAPASQLPDELRDAPANVQEAYRFAIANKALMEQIPCFCGCAGSHGSNYECYVAEDGGPGTILQYDYHALG